MRGVSFFILFCVSQISLAQSFNKILDKQPLFIEEFSITDLKENQLFISMPFAMETVLNPDQKKNIEEKTLIKLELVYTKYRTTSSFNQLQLNKKRVEALKSLVPSLFGNPLWGFELVCQTKGSSKEECKKMFHGFILTFRPAASQKTINQEADYIKNLITTLIKKDSLEADSNRRIHKVRTRYDLKLGYVRDTTWIKDTVQPVSPPSFFYDQSLYKDSTVLNAFERNKKWKKFIVVTDVTGSMSPYTAQVFRWLKKQGENKNATHFVFFNDGNYKPSNAKETMETGGIYVTQNKGIKSVLKEAIKCMNKGSGGGEGVENDVEAISVGLQFNSDANEVILIADNYESMRDYKFISKINKPVHVILCGTDYGLNTQYLDLARQTKGSIHTPKSDIYILHKVKENASILIDDNEYFFKKGRFHSSYYK